MNKVNHWDTGLDILKAIITKTNLGETTKCGICVFTLNNKNVIGVGGFKNFFTLLFFNGVF
ncbi:DUF1801 domain-containing protein [Flavobacterium taihuense]|uniref:DUF1801 domain-containing protein n=1 Tax=Flavobacterium taihuense TaxID=2857508 RepID=UPI0021062F4C|nr:DUF1801 domain-containing protein [Flavobacterium taihuense]